MFACFKLFCILHRYFCQQQFLEEGTELGRMKTKKIEWNLASELSDFIPTVSKFNPDTRRQGTAHRGINSLTSHRMSARDGSTPTSRKRSVSVGLDGEASNSFMGSLVVTVVNARALPVKEISSTMNMGGPFASVLPKLFVQVIIKCTTSPLNFMRLILHFSFFVLL